MNIDLMTKLFYVTITRLDEYYTDFNKSACLHMFLSLIYCHGYWPNKMSVAVFTLSSFILLSVAKWVKSISKVDANLNIVNRMWEQVVQYLSIERELKKPWSKVFYSLNTIFS